MRPEIRVDTPSTVFAALGDATRLRMVIRLSRGESLSITELASGTTMTRQAITKHLRVLEAARIATPSRLGREQRWELDQKQLEQARQFLDRISQRWDDALSRLKSLVEESDT